jgi:uncharacterized integral membrane protein (TIGR00698 family)
MNFLNNKLHGLALCFAIAVPAAYLGKLFPIIGAPVFAIILGLLMAGIPRSDIFQGGITFTSKKILQYAIILLGFGMNLFEIFRVGSQSLLIIISTIGTALVVSYAVSRIMKIDHDIATLVGVGSSICGGSAIAAAAPVIKASDEDIAQSISVIFLFNVIAAFLFPTLGAILGFNDMGFGMWAGNQRYLICSCCRTNLGQRQRQRHRAELCNYRQTDPHLSHHSYLSGTGLSYLQT